MNTIIKELKPVDLITLTYLFITGLFIILFSGQLHNEGGHLFIRMGFLIGIFLILYLHINNIYPFLKFLRHFYPLLLIIYLYSETDYLNNIFFQDLDAHFSLLESRIWGDQPSIEFSKSFPQLWFSELMSLAYFSFYVLIFVLCFWIYKFNYENFHLTSHLIFTSFYLYYLIFIFIPVAGPQFYFKYPDNQMPGGYLFSYLVVLAHKIGERPTAAFPSSHVGITCLVLFLSYKYAKSLLLYFIPLAFLLFLSTVYIKAHYVVDVFAGFFATPVLYWLSKKSFTLINQKIFSGAKN